MKRARRVAPRSRVRKGPLRGPKRPKPAGQKKKKRKLKAPKIPIKLQGPPPSYFELLQEAVQALKDMSKGASLPEIRQHLQRKYRGRFDKESNDLLTNALQRLAERGKVIRKEGFRYKFNDPNDVSVSADTSAASSFTGINGSDQSAASSGYLPTESGATAAKNADSNTSATSSFSDTNHSKEPNQGEAPEAEGKSSTGDLSSSAPSASSTASRASSKRR